ADRLDDGVGNGLAALAGSLELCAGFLRLDACVHDASLLNQPRLIHCRHSLYLPALSSSAFNSGKTWKRSATSPKSATWKIGASPSLLMATMTLLSFMPARCWMAPEMPTAMYSSGATILPVCPTCQSFGTNPASTAAREAPIAAFSLSASGSRILKFSPEPMPRPPDTTIFAAVSSGRSDLETSRLMKLESPLSAGAFVLS